VKTLTRFVGLFCCSFLFISISIAAETTSAWHLEKDKDQIQIYTRSVAGKPLKELKVISHFNVNAHTFLAFISDISAQPNYLYNCLASKLLKSTGDREHIYYQQTGLPWPCSNRDGVYRQIIQPDLKNKVVYIKIGSSISFLIIPCWQNTKLALIQAD
jgi:uncharacterized protein YigE (DUF2233 family)